MKIAALLLTLLPSLTLLAAAPPKYEVPGKISSQTPSSTEITPDAGPQVEGGIDVFLTADFIYWTARMDGLAYIASGLGNNQTNVGKGYVRHPEWEWDPGFKAGLGLNLHHDGWDIYAEFTWLRNSAHDRTSGNTLDPMWNISNLEAFLPPSTLPGAIQTASSFWNLHFNVVDLELGRNYFVSRHLSLRPHIGLKTSWQEMKYRVDYQVLFSDNNGTNESLLEMRNNPHFWGIGLRTGLDTSWHINRTFSIYGNTALSALWSQYKVNRKDTRRDLQNASLSPAPPLDTTITTYNTENNFHTLTAILEFSAGLRAEWWFFGNRYHILVQGGWEEQIWINHNQLVKANFTENASGDMLLQGLTIKLRFDF